MIMDDDGDLVVVGRMSHSERFKVAGDVVYAFPVETVITSHPKVKEARIVGHQSGFSFGHILIYCIV